MRPDCLRELSVCALYARKLSVHHTCSNRLLEVLNSTLLNIKCIALLMMQPSKLLQNLGMVGGVFQNPVVGILGIIELRQASASSQRKRFDRRGKNTSFCCS